MMPSLDPVKNFIQRLQPQQFHISYHQLISQLLRHPFTLSCLILAALLTVGTVGYMLIEGWEFSDALYMTVITVTTIGYGEVQSLSPDGRTFTIGLIIIGVIGATYAIGATVELLTSKEFLGQLRRRRRRRTLETLNNHTIICGYGRMGSSLAEELQIRDESFIVIDPSDQAIEQCHQAGISVIQGSASDEEILQEAGIDRAKALVAATRTDAENVFIILTARSINPDLRIIARSNAKTSIRKLEKAGANTVISPYDITGQRIAHMLTRPNVIQFLDGFLSFGNDRLRLEEFIISENSPLAGLTLGEAKLKIAVLAVDHPGETVKALPNRDTKLTPGTAMIVMGTDENLSTAALRVQGKDDT